MLKLSKIIPAHIKTVKFTHVKKEFLKMGPGYRTARARMRNPLDTCFWCEHPFKDGEWMALGIPEKGTNKVMCQECHDALEEVEGG